MSGDFCKVARCVAAVGVVAASNAPDGIAVCAYNRLNDNHLNAQVSVAHRRATPSVIL